MSRLPQRRARPAATPYSGRDQYGNPAAEWLKVDWNARRRSELIAGARTNLVEIGSGPAVLLLHGLAGSWQNFLDNLLPLAKRHRVIAVDLPGFGASPLPPWPITIPAYAAHLDALARQLDLGDTTIVGNSMGGLIAAQLALDGAAWVRRLVLVSAAGISHATMSPRPFEIVARASDAVGGRGLEFRKRMLRRPRVRWGAFRNVFYRPLELRSEFLYEQWNPALRPPGMQAATASLFGFDIRERLGAINLPTLLVWGRNDRIVSVADAPGYAERIPGARLVVFDRCGHLPMAERPDRFNALVGEFIGAD